MKPTVHTLLQKILKPFLLDTTNHRHKLAIFFPFHEPEGVHSGFNRAACRRRDRVDNAKNGLASKLLIDPPGLSSQLSKMSIDPHNIMRPLLAYQPKMGHEPT